MKRHQFTQGRRIVILCEGDTEEIAVKHFIRRQWDAEGLRAIGLHPINIGGKLEDVFAYVPRYRRDPQVIAVFTLVDLYGMNRVQHDSQDTLADKVARVKAWLRANLGSVYTDFPSPCLSS